MTRIETLNGPAAGYPRSARFWWVKRVVSSARSAGAYLVPWPRFKTKA